MAEINDIDRRVLGAIDGRERLKLLLKDAGLTLQEFAQKQNVWVEQVSMCLKGDRPYPEIREAIASELGLSRATVDELIDGPPADRVAS